MTGVKAATTTVAATTTATAATSSVSLVTIAVNAGTAALTAAATTAATTATISAINTSMNADGDIFKQAKTTTKTSWDTTTSSESIKNMAIAAAVAAGASLAGQWMRSEGVNPSLESGTMENSKVGVNVEKNVNGDWIKAGSVTDINPQGVSSNWFDTYVIGNQNPALQTLNTTPGAPPFANFHDAMNFSPGVNQITIAPYYAISQCAAAPTLCAMLPDTFIKVGTWGQVDTNLDINKTNYEQNR